MRKKIREIILENGENLIVSAKCKKEEKNIESFVLIKCRENKLQIIADLKKWKQEENKTK